MNFPIDLSTYQTLRFSVTQDTLDAEQKAALQKNISILRDSIVFFTALANTRNNFV